MLCEAPSVGLQPPEPASASGSPPSADLPPKPSQPWETGSDWTCTRHRARVVARGVSITATRSRRRRGINDRGRASCLRCDAEASKPDRNGSDDAY